MTIQRITDGLLNFVSLNAGALVGAQTTMRLSCHRQPHPMPHQFARVLDHPLRMAYRDPVSTLGEFGIAAGTTVLDLGCGAGTFTVEMARMVGESGLVHAVDIQSAFTQQARARVEAAGLESRVRFHTCGADHLPLADNSIDLAVVIATIGEIPNKAGTLAELRRVLKPGATLGISEELPDPAYTPEFLVSRWLDAAGFRYGGRSGTPFCYHLLYMNPDLDAAAIETEVDTQASGVLPD